MLEQGLGALFLKGPGNEYFWLCRPHAYDVCHSPQFCQGGTKVATGHT